MNKLRRFALILFLFILTLSLIGPWIAPYPIDEILDIPFSPPQPTMLLGSDYLGADVLSRMLSGGQTIILLTLLAVGLAWILGGTLGVLAALRGGITETIFLRIADLLLSIPAMLLLTLIVTITGIGYKGVVITAIFVMFPDIFRMTRAATLQQLQYDYIDLARCRGESWFTLLWYEIAPNLLSPMITDIGIRLPGTIFIFSTASFLGLSTNQPMADWGLMIMENSPGLTLQPLATLAPVSMLILLLIPLNFWLDSFFLHRQTTNRNYQTSDKDINIPTQDTILDIRKLTLSHTHSVLLSNINLKVSRGEIVALVGSSGSGKTTLLHSVLAHWPQNTKLEHGNVWMQGKSLLQMNASELRKYRAQHIGYMPQDPKITLVSSQRIGSFLNLIANSRGLSNNSRRLQIYNNLRQLGLPLDKKFLSRYPHQLSGGQRQRILLTAAMLGYPKLLLLDEPSSALDPLNTRDMLLWVAQTAREHNMTVLMVAHDLPQVSQIASRILLMSRGKLLEQQQTKKFLTSPTSPEGQRLIDSYTPGLISACIKQKSETIFHVRQLSASYKGYIAFHPLQFDLVRGGCLTIVGPSGSGKTTLLRTLLGLHHNCQGSMYFLQSRLAHGLANRTPEQRRAIQYVPQNPWSSLNPFYTVAALLERPLRVHNPNLPHNKRQKAVSYIMEQVGLSDHLLNRQSSELSGGQCQRVALARALIINPSILICDEITSALDGPGKREITELLDRLRHSLDIAIILVTHDMSLPYRLGGDLIVLKHGHVIEHGTTNKLITSPHHKFTRQLIDVSTIIGGNK
ncbi:TPA: ATP-binding cassette domain-containing protein [Salmonella enterica subsp. enterica serovar Typhimurium]|nr:ATP-binding cassette domain-containing protein [Salmonella enterica]HDO5799789.1 ATP-binding cassette domain-containing protein [Salmonella enterica subsp. enterica serovar Typhimurium]HED0201598.1 ATP-binding cassette domain-containing protein [Salmonella enterica subsp. enterica serovar Orientalis]